MKGLRSNVVVQFAVLVLAVTAGQLLLKMLVGLIPMSTGPVGAFKQVVASV